MLTAQGPAFTFAILSLTSSSQALAAWFKLPLNLKGMDTERNIMVSEGGISSRETRAEWMTVPMVWTIWGRVWQQICFESAVLVPQITSACWPSLAMVAKTVSSDARGPHPALPLTW